MTKKKADEETTLDLDEMMAEGMDRFEGELEPPAKELKVPSEEEAARKDETITPDAAGKKSPPEERGRKTEDGGRKSEDRGRKTEDRSRKSEEAEDLEKKEPEHPEERDRRSEVGDRKSEEAEDLEEEERAKKAEEEAAKKPEFRFKSQEESERGYRELQGKTTRLEQKNKELEEKLKEDKESERQKVELEKIDEEFLKFSETRHKEALKAIDDLDPDDEEYQGQVSRLWAEKDRDIRQYDRELMKRVEPLSPAPQSEGETEEEAAMAYVDQQARDADIDPKDEFYRLVCQSTPEKDETGKAMTFEGQVAWAIKRTRDYHGSQEGHFQERQKDEANRQSEINQDKGLSMGRSGAERVAESKEPKNVTLNDALELSYEEGKIA